MNRRLSRTLTAVSVAALVLGVGSCGGYAEADPEPEPITPTIRIGIKFDQPGVGLMTNGRPTGFDVDVAAYIAYKLGHSPYAIEWVEAVSPEREHLLEAGSVDMVVATYTILDERLPVVDFAGPYIVISQDLLVSADDTSIGSVDDLLGRSVCSANGTISIRRLRERLGNSANVIGRDRLSDCATMLANGEIDAMSTDDLILAGFAATDELFGRVRLVGSPLGEEHLGIGLPNNSPELCRRVNTALEEMVSDGSWQRFIDRHTGGTGYPPQASLTPPAPIPRAG
jgi:glutamate transport system substrate-binding protein